MRVDLRAREVAAVSKWEEDNGIFNTDYIFHNRYFPFEETGTMSSWFLQVEDF